SVYKTKIGLAKQSHYEEDQPTRRGMRRRWEGSCRIRMRLTGLPPLERVHRKLRRAWPRRDLLSRRGCCQVRHQSIHRAQALQLRSASRQDWKAADQSTARKYFYS